MHIGEESALRVGAILLGVMSLQDPVTVPRSHHSGRCESSSHVAVVHAHLAADVLDWVTSDSVERLFTLIHAASVGAPARAAQVSFDPLHSQFAWKFLARCEAYLLVQGSDDGRIRLCDMLSDTQVRQRRWGPTSNRGLETFLMVA